MKFQLAAFVSAAILTVHRASNTDGACLEVD
jgi:hypothetical protein